MPSYIRDHLIDKIKINPTPELANQISRLVLRYEIRGEHPLTLNSNLFGVNKFSFTPDDRNLLFEIVGTSEEDLVSVIQDIPTIQKEFKVISDPFNVLSVYLIHQFLNSNLQRKPKSSVVIDLLNYMQYRFMSSAVNHYFPHGANYDIMQTVIESLNMKFSIRQFGSWKKVINSRSESIVFGDKAHRNTLIKFREDKEILYLITDISTRIRSQLKIITAEYYTTKDTNNFIRSHSSTIELDGEKIIREQKGSFELMSSVVYSKVLNRAAWVDSRYIKMVQKSVPRLNTSIIQRLLLAISDESQEQMTRGESNLITYKRTGTEVYVGVETLINKIIWFVYNSAIRSERINLNSKIAVYENVKRIFSASRSADPTLLNIRLSVEHLCKRTRVTKRDSTISGLIIALVLYVTLHTFTVH